jgi:hypothetical protein
MKILFNESSVDWILGVFDKKIDNEGFVVDKRNKRVLCNKGKEIHKDELLMIKKNKNSGNNESYFAIRMPWS